MSHEFEPQRITTRDAIEWFKPAMGLVLRRPHYFLLPILPVIIFPDGWLEYFLLFPVYSLIVFTLLLSLSETSDKSERFDPRKLWKQLLIALGFNAIVMLGLTLLRSISALLVLFESVPVVVQQMPVNIGPDWMLKIQDVSGNFMHMLVVFLYVMGWFRHALLIFTQLTPQLARHLSYKATRLNFLVIWLVAMMFLLVNIIGIYTPVWVEFAINVALMLILPPYLYVAFRHIFLGKKENAPVVVKQPETVAAPHHA